MPSALIGSLAITGSGWRHCNLLCVALELKKPQLFTLCPVA